MVDERGKNPTPEHQKRAFTFSAKVQNFMSRYPTIRTVVDIPDIDYVNFTEDHLAIDGMYTPDEKAQIEWQINGPMRDAIQASTRATVQLFSDTQEVESYSLQIQTIALNLGGRLSSRTIQNQSERELFQRIAKVLNEDGANIQPSTYRALMEFIFE